MEVILKDCREFVERGDQRSEFLDALKRFLESEPRNVSTPAPAYGCGDLDERRALGETMMQILEGTVPKMDWNITSTLWSIFSVAPLPYLRGFVSMTSQPAGPVGFVEEVRTRLEILLKTCE